MCGAALCASVTHAISISVIVFELTGQITYVLPILTSVLVSNALSRHLQPSMYDSLIKVKNITVLPKMRLSNIPGGEQGREGIVCWVWLGLLPFGQFRYLQSHGMKEMSRHSGLAG